MVEVRMTLEEFNALRMAAGFAPITGNPQQIVPTSMEINTPVGTLPGDAPARRKPSAYNRKYKAAFRKVAPRYKLKSGKWKANGFRLAVKAAHDLAGGKKKRKGGRKR